MVFGKFCLGLGGGGRFFFLISRFLFVYFFVAIEEGGQDRE